MRSRIADSEMDDFLAIVEDHGLVAGDFEVEFREQPLPPGLGPHPIHGAVEVRHTPTGVVRVYQIGPLSSWGSDFQSDIEHHVLG